MQCVHHDLGLKLTTKAKALQDIGLGTMLRHKVKETNFHKKWEDFGNQAKASPWFLGWIQIDFWRWDNPRIGLNSNRLQEFGLPKNPKY